jgi:hypothetical protein
LTLTSCPSSPTAPRLADLDRIIEEGSQLLFTDAMAMTAVMTGKGGEG